MGASGRSQLLTSTASTIRPSAARGNGVLQPAVIDRVVHRPVPTPVLGRERQLDQRRHRAVRAQHRVGQLEERIRPGVEAVVELNTKVGQDTQRGVSGLFRGETLHQRPFLHATLLDTS